MDNELYKIQEMIKEYVNKYDIKEININILKLYDKKSVIIQAK